MNKSELIKSIAEKTGFSQKDVTCFYDAYVNSIAEALKKGDKVQLLGFGSYEVKDVAAKTGVNPKTGEQIKIPATKKPVLKFGKAFKDLFN